MSSGYKLERPPSKKITFRDEKIAEEMIEPGGNSRSRGKQRRGSLLINQLASYTPNNMLNLEHVVRGRGGRYSLFISGLQHFDPYQELTPTQIAAFRQVFDLVDKDGGGTIDAEELYQSMKDLDPSLKLKEIKEVIDELDQDGHGTISFQTFLYLMTSMNIQIRESVHDYNSNINSTGNSVGKKRQSVFFSVITKFAMRHSLKEIERYYASKSRHDPHVVAHYAAGACVEGLSEKELRQEWKHLVLANKGKDSPYAQPLVNFIKAPKKEKGRLQRKSGSRRGPLLSISESSTSPSSQGLRSASPSSTIDLDEMLSRCSPRTKSPSSRSPSSCTKSPNSPRPESRGWTPRHGLPITKVPLPMVIYDSDKSRTLTILDMDKLREDITVARNCYYNQLNLENEEKAAKYWETLKINEIPSARLRRNFLQVFRAYTPTNEYENHINRKPCNSRAGKVNQDLGFKSNSRSPVVLRL